MILVFILIIIIIEDVKAILQTMGIKLHKGCLSVVFDAKGGSYEVPNYCLNKPHKYIIKEDKKPKTVLEENLKAQY